LVQYLLFGLAAVMVGGWVAIDYPFAWKWVSSIRFVVVSIMFTSFLSVLVWGYLGL